MSVNPAPEPLIAVAIKVPPTVKLSLKLTEPVTESDPVIKTEPVNWCLSSPVSPNFVEPEVYKTDAETIVV